MIPTSPDTVSIELDNVSKHYASGNSEVRAVTSASLRVHRSERVAILGKSGCGKSTLLNLIGGLDRATSGQITVDGKMLSDMTSNQIADFRRDVVGMIFQSYNLVASRTALQNVEMPAIFAGCDRNERREASRQLLDAVGLKNRGHHRPSELSGGEQQRVAIARALINKPSLLLADEPTGNLDSTTAAEVVELLETVVHERRMTLVFVTHDEQLASRLGNRVLRMTDGRLEEA
jgi:ABC-type lipoprotein export system ATPase subunit